MLALATGILLKDPEVKVSQTGKRYVRVTLHESHKEQSLFTVFANAETQSFDALSLAQKGEAVTVQGALVVSAFKDGSQRISIDVMANLVIPIKG